LKNRGEDRKKSRAVAARFSSNWETKKNLENFPKYFPKRHFWMVSSASKQFQQSNSSSREANAALHLQSRRAPREGSRFGKDFGEKYQRIRNPIGSENLAISQNR
jgi:hypothetical protein